MSEPVPAEQRFTGVAASGGLARGIIHHIALTRPAYTGQGQAADRDALRRAIAEASTGLTALMAETDDAAAGILGFQLAMLEDDTLTEPAYAAIATGTPADAAWAAALDELIVDFAGSDDETFAARAADLRDLRDRVLDALCGAPSGLSGLPEGAILVAEDLTPSHFLEVDWTRARGAALAAGSRAGHVAILARARGVPMLVGLGARARALPDGAPAWVDADDGALVIHPGPTSESELAKQRDGRHAASLIAESFRDLPARTNGGEPVAIFVNLDDPERFPHLLPRSCDGVGLARSEFLFHRPDGRLPDEDQQFAAYARLIRWAEGLPVTIRTLDAGGDKPIPGLTHDGERNPFLGLRGLRLSLARPDVFAVQLRALMRAATLGPLKVMLPMVTNAAEVEAVRALLEDEHRALGRAGTQAAMPALGMMVEVPAAALGIADFAVDFYSIGTNDLIQYLCAAARDNDAVAALYDPGHPAVLACLRTIAAHGIATGREVSLCGDMASQPAWTATLLGCGLRALSVTPAAIASVKQAVAAS